jgi:hypothetical protein
VVSIDGGEFVLLNNSWLLKKTLLSGVNYAEKCVE